MIYVTGDTHGMDFNRLSRKNFPFGAKLDKHLDYLCILGDFGGVFSAYGESGEEKWWLDWLNDLPFTLLFVDGNHENFDRLEKFPVEHDWHGGDVQFIRENVIHLMRGQVYDIPTRSSLGMDCADHSLKIFTFGGANSIDKDMRIEGVSWWPQEMPNYEEETTGLVNLEEKANFCVDYIFTHDCPTHILFQINKYFNVDSINRYFEEISERVSFKKWFFGHHHLDMQLGSEDTHDLHKYQVLYNDILNVEDDEYWR